MLSREDVLKLFEEWMEKIESGIDQKNGNTLCESTRMVLAFALILHAYFPDALTTETTNRMGNLFERALACVTKVLSQGENPDGCYDLYQRNIRERIEKFQELQLTWQNIPTLT